MNKLAVPVDVKQIQITDENTAEFEGYAAVFGNVDWYNDVIVKGAFAKTLEKWQKAGKKIPLLYQHRPEEVIGTIEEFKEDDYGLWVKGKINLNVEKGREVYSLLKQGALYGLSIGFEVKKEQWDGEVRKLLEIELWEVSIVTFPANELAEVVSVKAVVPFQNLPLADRETPWDANAARQRLRKWASSDGSGDLDKVDWKKYRKAFLWYDEEKPDNAGSYKFPIADVINGQLKAVPRAIFAAAAVLQGARGGTNIPEADIEKMKKHLEKYYAKLDMTPPWANKDIAELYDAYLKVLNSEVRDGILEVLKNVIEEKLYEPALDEIVKKWEEIKGGVLDG